MDERREMYYVCEICGKEPATDIQGGSHNGIRDMYIVCVNCKKLVKDERNKERFNEKTN